MWGAVLTSSQVPRCSASVLRRCPEAAPAPAPSYHLAGQRKLEEARCPPGGEPPLTPSPDWAAPAACAPSHPASASASGPAAELLTAYLIGRWERATWPKWGTIPCRNGKGGLPPAPKPAFASSPSVLSRPLHTQLSQRGRSQAPPWGRGEVCSQEGRGLERGRAPRSGEGRGRLSHFLRSLGEAPGSLSPRDPTWDRQSSR